MENVRYNISPCLANEAKQFVDSIDNTVYSPRNFIMADERSHYDRYSFLRGDSKIAVVYDTTAQVISITASQEYADDLLKLFGPDAFQTVKRSTVPAQNAQRSVVKTGGSEIISSNGVSRSKVFITPQAKTTHVVPTVIATARGAEISTDEIYPPQRAKKRVAVDNFEGYTDEIYPPQRAVRNVRPEPAPLTFAKPSTLAYTIASKQAATEHSAEAERQTDIAGLNISASTGKKSGRRPTISFGSDDDYKNVLPAPSAAKNGAGKLDPADVTQPKRRGRPPKNKVDPLDNSSVLEYKNGYSVKGMSENDLTAIMNALKAGGAKIAVDAGAGEVNYTVTADGQKAAMRYSTAKRTLALQGKQSRLYSEIMRLMSADNSPASTAVVTAPVVSQKQTKAQADDERLIKHKLPTAAQFLSEQAKADFLCGLRDFSKRNLQLSDYSVLLVPPFRGLERFVFDLQHAEGIQVKMIGQAFDKDEDGKYILKRGYQQRIGSVVYAEVMVSLYTEYFSQRNFFAHSDNTADSVSRAIADRESAKRIFERLLDVVEYNSKKLKEINFSMSKATE